MNYLLVSIASAFAIALSVYSETASLFYAFAAYSLTGTIVLSLVLLTALLDLRADDASSDA